jgi:hypothetical protein
MRDYCHNMVAFLTFAVKSIAYRSIIVNNFFILRYFIDAKKNIRNRSDCSCLEQYIFFPDIYDSDLFSGIFHSVYNFQSAFFTISFQVFLKVCFGMLKNAFFCVIIKRG